MTAAILSFLAAVALAISGLGMTLIAGAIGALVGAFAGDALSGMLWGAAFHLMIDLAFPNEQGEAA